MLDCCKDFNAADNESTTVKAVSAQRTHDADVNYNTALMRAGFGTSILVETSMIDLKKHTQCYVNYYNGRFLIKDNVAPVRFAAVVQFDGRCVIVWCETTEKQRNETRSMISWLVPSFRCYGFRSVCVKHYYQSYGVATADSFVCCAAGNEFIAAKLLLILRRMLKQKLSYTNGDKRLRVFLNSMLRLDNGLQWAACCLCYHAPQNSELPLYTDQHIQHACKCDVGYTVPIFIYFAE
jgi:hypothetical protein